MSESAPAGVRPTDGTPLRWVQPGLFALQYGDRVVVHDGDADWLGVVVIPPEQLLEWTDPASLPVVARLAEDADWPAAPVRAGRRLLESLALAPELLARTVPGSASGPLVADACASPREPAQHE